MSIDVYVYDGLKKRIIMVGANDGSIVRSDMIDETHLHSIALRDR